MAHPPIHPTQYVPLDSIGDVTERRIYEYVVRHFLACCSWDAQGDTTQVDVELGEEQFECKGLQIRDLAYMHVYTYETWTGNVIPTMADGQRLVPTRLAINESRTAPPQHLSEAELIGLVRCMSLRVCGAPVLTLPDADGPEWDWDGRDDRPAHRDD